MSTYKYYYILALIIRTQICWSGICVILSTAFIFFQHHCLLQILKFISLFLILIQITGTQILTSLLLLANSCQFATITSVQPSLLHTINTAQPAVHLGMSDSRTTADIDFRLYTESICLTKLWEGIGENLIHFFNWELNRIYTFLYKRDQNHFFMKQKMNWTDLFSPALEIYKLELNPCVFSHICVNELVLPLFFPPCIFSLLTNIWKSSTLARNQHAFRLWFIYRDSFILFFCFFNL